MSRPVVLGLDFGGSKMAVAVASPDAAPTASLTVAVRPSDTAEATFRRGIDTARSLLADTAPGSELVAVGVCTLGIPRQSGVDLAPNIAGWERIEFGTQLRAAFPDAVVRMGNDVKVAAQAELDRGALAGCDTGVYLNLGTGLAAAIVVGGRVVHGAHGAAGEIGYNLRQPFDHHDTTRLEDVVSGRALELASGELFGAADVAALFDRASKERRARRLCEQFVAELTYHVANLAVAVDPERVVVGGGLMRAWEHLQPALAAALEAAVPFPPELVPAAHPFDAPLIGALAMASAAFRAAATDSRETVPEGAPA